MIRSAVALLAYTAAVALTVAAFGWTILHGLAQPAAAIAFGTLTALGGLGRTARPGVRRAVPLATAGALAYALLGSVGGRPTTHGALQAVAVVVLASAATQVWRAVPLRDMVWCRGNLDDAVRRLLCVGFVAGCFQITHYCEGLRVAGVTPGMMCVVFLLAVFLVTALGSAVLAATFTAARTGCPYRSALRDELRALPETGAVVCAGAAGLSIAVGIAGLWALPVFSVPLLLAQVAFRRHAAVRATHRQTIASLARATEVAGYTPAGHARRVSVLCELVGREMGMATRELLVLEHAALMHDIGQLSLVDPVPRGATASLAPAEQRRIALLGGEVVRQTGAPGEVAVIVECQADPYREQPLAGRIVRAVNAYEELVAGDDEVRGAVPGRGGALEELRAAAGTDYDPSVVEALARVLYRGAGRTRGWRAPGATGMV